MPDLRSYIDETARAVSFLSRLPVPARFFDGHDGSLAKTAAAFPLAGLLIGLPAAAALALCLALGATPAITALVTVAVQIVVTGALHEDGLSDTADGLGAAHDREKALAIMKDSRIGTYGALALILSISLRSAALAALCAFGQLLPTLVSWLAAGCLSRTFMVWHWSDLPPARLGGVASRVGAPDKSTARFALASGTVLTLALGCLALPVLPLLAAMLVAGLLGLVFTAHIRNRLGGHTGDTIGACQQLAEIAFLVSLAIGL